MSGLTLLVFAAANEINKSMKASRPIGRPQLELEALRVSKLEYILGPFHQGSIEPTLGKSYHVEIRLEINLLHADPLVFHDETKSSGMKREVELVSVWTHADHRFPGSQTQACLPLENPGSN